MLLMPRQCRWLLTTILCGMLILPQTVAATPTGVLHDGVGGDYHLIRVGPGGDYVQLASALAAAPPGAVIEILPGLHAGQWTIDRPLTLRGMHGAVLDGLGTGVILTIAAPGVTVEGLHFQHSGSYPIDAALVVRASDSAIVGNRIERFQRGIVIENGANAVIRNNTLIGAPDHAPSDRSIGIALLNAPNALVEFNTVLAVQVGIAIDSAPRGVIRGNVVRRVGMGIVSPLIAGTSPLALDVAASFFSAALCLPSVSDIVIDRNTLAQSVTGIKLAGSARVMILGNRIEDQQGDGLLTHNSTGLIVANNRFARNVRAITVGGSGTMTAQRNHLLDNGAVLALLDGDAVIALRNNDIVGYRVATMRESQAPVAVWEGNYWEQNWLQGWWLRQQAKWHDRDGDGLSDQLLQVDDGVIDYRPAVRPQTMLSAQPSSLRLWWIVALAFLGGLIATFIRQRKGLTAWFFHPKT